MAIALLTGCGAQPRSPSPVVPAGRDDLKRELQDAISARQWSRALELSQQAMIAYPGDADVLTNAAIARAQSGQRAEAAELMVDAVRATDYSTSGGRIEHAVAALLDVGHLYDAIALVREVVRKNPDAASYRRMLVGFLGEAQLTEDIDQHLAPLIEQRQFDLPLLLATTEMSARRFSSDTIQLLLERNPDDLRPLLGEAKQSLDQRDAGGAEGILRRVIKQHPDFAPAHAMLGVALAAQGKQDAYPAWYRSLPSDTTRWSGYWFALGDWALSTGDREGAVKALAEATRREPNEPAYWALLLAALNQWHEENEISDVAVYDPIKRAILRRQADLLALRDQFSMFKTDGQKSQTLAVGVAKTLYDLGRVWESEAWLAIATTLRDDPSEELTSFREQVVSSLQRDRAWQSTQNHLELSFDLSRFELPTDLLKSMESGESVPTRQSLAAVDSLRLSEEAGDHQLSFYGRIGESVRGPWIPITQSLGCGGAMLDYDQDGRLDMALAAAGGKIGARDSDPGTLLRNIGKMVDVGLPSAFGDRGFSQGIAVGDYNDDGLADILVLNLGPNHLFRNNGDGTFTDASDVLGDNAADQWSTSGAICDVNQDGLCDIVIVNYCDSRDPLEDPCTDAEGARINCYPLKYRAAQDQILAGNGDGTFSDKTADWIADAALGRGLGVVAGRLDGQQSCIYIVNDASPNTFYRWQAEENKLVDQAIASGLAVDRQSLDQGSMGIASSDFDGDGDLDFYVTGFSNEYNILYEQQSPGFWLDNTASKGLVTPTLNAVGFGTEGIDLDNDGFEEILVANGHVGIFTPPQPPYAQHFQLFRRGPDGSYRSEDMNAWGNYFQSTHIGRALFTGDVDGDGLCDAAVTHATEPVALLMNRTEPRNHRITFRLIDPLQCRDATGATVELECDSETGTVTKTLFEIAGHGYLCTNERLLWAGLGSSSTVRVLRITWPDGSRQVFHDLKADAMYLIVRGEKPFLLRQYSQPGQR